MALEQRAHLMGTEVHVVVDGPAGALDPASLLGRLAELEARWSRFEPTSEVSHLNELAGGAVVVSRETAALVARSLDAWRATGGRFDPFVGDLMLQLGYERSFPWPEARGSVPGHRPSPSAFVDVDESTGLVVLPPGASFDPGGIGKGYAADLVVEELESQVTQDVGVLLNVGGDLRVRGEPPVNGWEVEIDHLVGPPVRVAMTHGALATSSTRRRRWRTPARESVHHVIDPGTCRPAAGPVASVSVLAGAGWWAEALATAVVVGGGRAGGSESGRADLLPEPALLEGVGILITLHDGQQFVAGDRAEEFTVVTDFAQERAATSGSQEDAAVRPSTVGVLR